MQGALEELGARLWYVYAAHRCLGQRVGRYQCQAVDANVVDAVYRLQHFAHPLEALFFRGIWPLLSHNHNSFISEHLHRKHSNSATIDKLHGLNSEHRRNQIIRIMPSAPNLNQTIFAAAHKHKSTRSQKSKQSTSHELVVADRAALGADWQHFEHARSESLKAVVAAGGRLGAHANLADLVGLAERVAVELEHAHQRAR